MVLGHGGMRANGAEVPSPPNGSEPAYYLRSSATWQRSMSYPQVRCLQQTPFHSSPMQRSGQRVIDQWCNKSPGGRESLKQSPPSRWRLFLLGDHLWMSCQAEVP